MEDFLTLAIPQELSDLPELGVQRQANLRNQINGTQGNDIIATTAQDDEVNALGGNDTIVGSAGNDLLVGGKGTDTVNYSRLGGPVTLGVRGVVTKGVDGALGQDQIVGIETLIGSSGAGDTIDGTTNGSGTVPINVDLSKNILSVIGIPGLGTQTFTVRNFENVTGTVINDIITGDFKNNVLNGGDGDDILTGTSGTNLRAEVDTLIGGAGDDTFVLGQGSTLFYSNNRNADFANITDFSNGADLILLAEGNYATNDDLSRLFAIKADGTRDLIAKISFFKGTGDSFSQRQAAPAAAFGEAEVDSLSAGNTFSLSSGQSFGIFSARIV